MKKLLTIITPVALCAAILGCFLASPTQANAKDSALALAAKEIGTVAHTCQKFCGCHHHHHGHYWCCGGQTYYCGGHH